jgi:hypothetical protein
VAKIKLYSLLPTALLLFASSPRANADELIVNGGFESNGGSGSSTFTGWTVATQPGRGGNGFYAQSGTASPFNGIPVAAPPGGNFAAMTDSSGPSSQALIQTFSVVGPGALTLSFDFFRVDVTNGAFDSALGAPPDSLDYNNIPNQQARVDILGAGAGAFDMGGAGVGNVLTTTPLDLLGSGCFPEDCSYQHLAVDLSALLGGGAGTYQLRFAEVDDLGPFIFGVDNVSLGFTPTTAPEPGSLFLLTTVIAGVGAYKWLR